MRRPSLFAFALGHRVASLGLLAASLGSFALFLQRHDNFDGGLAVLSLVFSRYASIARARVLAYRNWKQAWAQMRGGGTEPRASRPARRRIKRGPILLAVWLLLAFWMGSHPEQAGTPAYSAAAIGFTGLTFWGVGAALLAAGRRLRRGGKRKRPAGEFIVTVVPPIPRSAPSLAQITSALPAYCKRLMADSSPSS